jgi:hypothetical protein
MAFGYCDALTTNLSLWEKVAVGLHARLLGSFMIDVLRWCLFTIGDVYEVFLSYTMLVLDGCCFLLLRSLVLESLNCHVTCRRHVVLHSSGSRPDSNA